MGRCCSILLKSQYRTFICIRKILYLNTSKLSFEVAFSPTIATRLSVVLFNSGSICIHGQYIDHSAHPTQDYDVLLATIILRLIDINGTILSFDAENEGERAFLVDFHVSPLELNRSLDCEPSVRILGNGCRK